MKILNANLIYANPLIPLNKNKVLYLTIHHPAIEYATPEQIHRYHLDNGWSGAGYNAYIRKDGTIYIMRGMNIGAQTENMNSKTYGICCEGNYDKETKMPDAQFKALVEFIKYIKPEFPNLLDVVPHSKFNSTSCPGRYFPFAKVMTALSIIEEEIDEEFKNNLAILQSYGKISSPEYWLTYCREGQKVDGVYAKVVLNKFAELLKSWY